VSRFFRAGLLAAVVACVLGLAPSTVLADANPNNHGHHYGQLKHRLAPPPVTNPPPSSQHIPAITSVTLTAGHRLGNAPAAAQQATSLAIPWPVLKAGALRKVDSTPSSGESWLLLLILPALLAVWLLVFARAALAAARRRRRPAPA
jgi:hypothetical protein